MKSTVPWTQQQDQQQGLANIVLDTIGSSLELAFLPAEGASHAAENEY
jgi:hypothetical protein